MTMQLTLTLPDHFIQRAQRWADLDALTDAQVLALTHLQMDPAKDARLSVLLEQQQAASLTPVERAELDELMFHYEIGLLRKAEALAEAVRRELREPLHP